MYENEIYQSITFIIGISIGSFVLIVIAIVTIVCQYKKRKIISKNDNGSRERVNEQMLQSTDEVGSIEMNNMESRNTEAELAVERRRQALN